MKTKKVAVIGFGNIGSGVVQLLYQKELNLSTRFFYAGEARRKYLCIIQKQEVSFSEKLRQMAEYCMLHQTISAENQEPAGIPWVNRS